MEYQVFLILLSAFSVVVSLITQAVKKMLDDAQRKYSANFIVLLISVVVGIAGTAVYYIFMELQFTLLNVICMILMGLAVWLLSMCGYDKVIQCIKQFAGIGIYIGGSNGS